jgi:hypothetical protein
MIDECIEKYQDKLSENAIKQFEKAKKENKEMVNDYSGEELYEYDDDVYTESDFKYNDTKKVKLPKRPIYYDSEMDAKNKKILECSNEMLRDCVEKNRERMNDNTVDEVEKAIKANETEIKNTKFTHIADLEPTRNNRFIIKIESPIINMAKEMIRMFYDDRERHELTINVNEYIHKGECMPMILDECIDHSVEFTIDKTIVDPAGEGLYTVRYYNCKIMKYSESPLSYDDDSLRNFYLTFGYKSYYYFEE